MFTARIQTEDIDVAGETAALRHATPEAGALANFLGVVRSTAERPITALTLEHYPGMTDAALERIGRTAVERFALLGCTIIHRVGTLRPGDAIVLVLTAAQHRGAALDATAFLIDWLKTDAPFWKKEHLPDGAEAWVAARADDDHAAARWTE